MSDFYILDDDGTLRVVDVLVWAAWYRTAERHVARTQIGNVRVSTAFLGLDHRFVWQGPPVLWASTVVGGPLDGEQRRYTSHAEALVGHDELCTLVWMEQDVASP